MAFETSELESLHAHLSYARHFLLLLKGTNDLNFSKNYTLVFRPVKLSIFLNAEN